MVPTHSHGIPRAPRYSGSTLWSLLFAYKGLTFFARSSQIFRLSSLQVMSVRTPACAGLGSSLFARRYSGNRVFFLFLPVLRCFSSRGCLRYTMDSYSDQWVLPHWGFPIRISACLCLLAARRGFSQLTTSFIGS